MRAILFVLLASLFIGGTAFAQGAKPIPADVLAQFQKDLEKFRPEEPPSSDWDKLAFLVTQPNAIVHAVPDAASPALSKADVGTAYAVLANEANGWVGVDYKGKTGWLSTDTGDVKPANEVVASSASWWERQVEKLVKEAADMKAQYDKNPYILVKGFSLSLGLSPSINIDFEFK